MKKIREFLISKQREFGQNKRVVMDGRDIGTTVFPSAEIKLWITASIEIRSARRYKELLEKGYSPSLKEVTENIIQRDHEDSNRKESPLRRAPEAIDIDNSRLTKNETLHFAMSKINDYLTIES